MRARTSATVTVDSRIADLHCEPPLTLRHVHVDGVACGLCLVGTAAGPLPGDDLALELILEHGARAVLSATGASIAQGAGAPSALSMSATLGEHAHLVADPGPLIVCRGSRVDVAVRLDLATSAQVQWRELLVLGRTTDAEPGAATVRWDVVRAGRPVLRQRLALRTAAERRWTTGGHRVLATAFVSSPTLAAATVVHAETAVAQAVDAHTLLVTVLDDSAAAARQRLELLVRAATEATSSVVTSSRLG